MQLAAEKKIATQKTIKITGQKRGLKKSIC